MSGYKGIRAVSSTLKKLLLAEMDTDDVGVTLLPPDVTPSEANKRRLNLYLYMVTENGDLRNQEIPGQGHHGSYGHPPLSLNLHYLMTAYSSAGTGDDQDLIAQEVLGDGMRVLHDYSIITRESTAFIAPELKDEFESIRISLQAASLEELSKIWSALPSASFRCSVVYNVTVVQIESRQPRQLAAPVETRRLHMSLVRPPQIDRVFRTPKSPGDPIGDPRASVGQSITITGAGFSGAKTWVKIGSLDPIRVSPLSNGDIEMLVPRDQYPDETPIPPANQLQPGPHWLQVLVQRKCERVEGGLFDKGATFNEEITQFSNQGVFELVP